MMAKIWWAALLCGAALTLPARAQQGGGTQDQPPPTPPPETEKKEAPAAPEATPAPKKKWDLEDPPLHRWGGFTVSLAGWSPSPVGADEQIALIYKTGQLPTPLTIPLTSNIREAWKVAYHLPGGYGSIVGRYDSMNNHEDKSYSSPGQFIYGITLGDPEFAGAFDDGLADGIHAFSMVKNRDTRFEYSDTAFENKRVKATWGAGFVNIDHNEMLQATYFALVPNLPAVIPPIVPQAIDPAQFQPIPDRVLLQSDYSGNGVSGSFDVEFKLFTRLSVISGVSVALVRGGVSSTYKSFTSFYQSAIDGHYIDKEELFNTLQFGPATCDVASGITECIAAITQATKFIGYYAPNQSHAAQAWNGYIGLQTPIWRGLRAFVTFRESYYQNVGLDAVLHDDQSVTTTAKSVGYEGYELGVSWRF
ncbi:MAG TPA: hypothetical protein VFV19_14220 [Candidatus Polarisedimenticolaceae bacterium]|nr:hypothetical protein [Candidatus Polarisedimenticolaceae bacterium]